MRYVPLGLPDNSKSHAVNLFRPALAHLVDDRKCLDADVRVRERIYSALDPEWRTSRRDRSECLPGWRIERADLISRVLWEMIRNMDFVTFEIARPARGAEAIAAQINKTLPEGARPVDGRRVQRVIDDLVFAGVLRSERRADLLGGQWKSIPSLRWVDGKFLHDFLGTRENRVAFRAHAEFMRVRAENAEILPKETARFFQGGDEFEVRAPMLGRFDETGEIVMPQGRASRPRAEVVLAEPAFAAFDREVPEAERTNARFAEWLQRRRTPPD